LKRVTNPLPDAGTFQSRDLDRVFLAQHRIENRLIRQARWECAHSSRAHQFKLLRPDRSPKDNNVFAHLAKNAIM
jgi:hypothetical protein